MRHTPCEMETRRPTRREQRKAMQLLARQMRDLESELLSMIDETDESEFELEPESEPERELPEELLLWRRQQNDHRPTAGRKMNRHQRGGRDLLDGYEMISQRGFETTRGAISDARAIARANGEDGAWWPRLFARRH